MKALEAMLSMIESQDAELFKAAKAEIYELKHGKHYNHECATEDVAAMYSRDTNGIEHHGEYYTLQAVTDAIRLYIDCMSNNDTIYDAYVICNAFWHDLSHNHPGDDSTILSDALTWAFCDEDAPEGKVWRYMQAMK